MTPPKIGADALTVRTFASNTGRYRDAPPPLRAWALACAFATMTEVGVVDFREVVRLLGLRTIPVFVDFFLVSEIPFTVASPDDELTMQIERPIGVDAQEYTLGTTRKHVDTRTNVTTRVLPIHHIPVREAGWHVIRVWREDVAIIECPYRVVVFPK